jgi:8-oxo-dGTP pyrophosphatase MutT (NUDIX family)
MADVEVPGSRRFEHHVVRVPCEAAGTVVHDADRGLLLLWRHRFITDTWGWEIPAGRVEPGESPEQAARRETVEETGWRPNGLSHLVTYQPANGLSDQRFNIFLGHDAVQVGEPTDPAESERVEWVRVEQVVEIAKRGQMVDGLSLTAVLYAFAFAGLR